jgi:hypothetical protein
MFVADSKCWRSWARQERPTQFVPCNAARGVKESEKGGACVHEIQLNFFHRTTHISTPFFLSIRLHQDVQSLPYLPCFSKLKIFNLIVCVYVCVCMYPELLEPTTGSPFWIPPWFV